MGYQIFSEMGTCGGPQFPIALMRLAGPRSLQGKMEHCGGGTHLKGGPTSLFATTPDPN